MQFSNYHFYNITHAQSLHKPIGIFEPRGTLIADIVKQPAGYKFYVYLSTEYFYYNICMYFFDKLFGKLTLL